MGLGYCFPSGCCSEGSGLPEQDGCCERRLAKHQDPGGSSLSSLSEASVPSVSSPLCQPLCQGSTVPGSLLRLLIWSLSTHQSGLSTTEWGQSPAWGWDYCFPSGYCRLEGSGLREHGVCCHQEEITAPGSRCLLSPLSPPSFRPGSLLRQLFCPCLCQSPG